MPLPARIEGHDFRASPILGLHHVTHSHYTQLKQAARDPQAKTAVSARLEKEGCGRSLHLCPARRQRVCGSVEAGAKAIGDGVGMYGASIGGGAHGAEVIG